MKQAFLTDSNAELFMYLIQCIRVRLMKSTASEPGLIVPLEVNVVEEPLQRGSHSEAAFWGFSIGD